MYDFHAQLPDTCQRMLNDLAKKQWIENQKSGRINASMVLAKLIAKEHKEAFPAKYDK